MISKNGEQFSHNEIVFTHGKQLVSANQNSHSPSSSLDGCHDLIYYLLRLKTRLRLWNHSLLCLDRLISNFSIVVY